MSLRDFYLCGWRVASEIPLPELMRWQGGMRAADIEILLGKVSWTALSDQAPLSIAMAHDGRSLQLRADDIAVFEIRDHREVIVDISPSASMLEVRVLLLGNVLGLLCHLRGLLPLHASCVRIGDEAVAFMGDSGSGKSTLAAALALRGHSLLSDDVCAVDMSSGTPLVLPSFPAVRLLNSSVDVVGIRSAHDGSVLEDVSAEKHKFRLVRVDQPHVSPVRLGAVYQLDPTMTSGDDVTVELVGHRKLAMLSAQIFRYSLARRIGRAQAAFAAAAQVAESAAVVARLARRRDVAQLADTVHLLEARHGKTER